MSGGKTEQGDPTRTQTKQKTAGTATTTVPDYLQPLVQHQLPGAVSAGIQGLQQGVQDYQVPQESIDALTGIAGGNYLYGGSEMEAYLDAARRAAAGGINSQFGAAGRSGSGLWHNAREQAGIDAFANMFPQMLQMRQQAALQLPQLGLIPLELQRQLANTAGGQIGQFAPLYGSNTTGQTSQNRFAYPQPTQSNQLASIGGGALTGASAGSMFGPYGTAIGGIGGGLLGAFA